MTMDQAFDRLVDEWHKAEALDTGDPAYDCGFSAGIEQALETLYPDRWPVLWRQLATEAAQRVMDALIREYPESFETL